VKIAVVDNQIEAALKALKKQMLRDGLFQEMKRRAHYEKPRSSGSARRRRREGNDARPSSDPSASGTR